MLPEAVEVRVGGRGSSALCVKELSGFEVGRGGGNGDIDMDVTLAEWA